MKKPLPPRALMSHRLQSLVPWMAALAVLTHQALWDSRSPRPTSSDMTAAADAAALSAAAPTPATARTLYSRVAPATDEAASEVSPNALAIPHEHLNRVNHLARARTLRELGDLPGALTECRRALYDAPGDGTEALRTIARLGPLTGQTELAVLAQEQLSSQDPEDASPLVQQARLLLSLSRSDEAIRVGEDAVARDPEDTEAYQVLGRAHLAAGHLSEAIFRFEQTLHLDPEHGHALNNLGLAWLRANENAKAAEVLARAAGLLPHVAYVHNNLGVAYERLGRTEDAQAAYTAATRLSPRYVKAHVNANRMNKVASLGVSTP